MKHRFTQLRKALQGSDVSLVAVPENLVDIVWGTERPSEPNNQVVVLPDNFNGRAWQDKLAAIRREMTTANAKLLVLSALDEIAWTFNLRGSDIVYNPVFFAYAIIGHDFVSLFIDERKVSDQMLVHLNAAHKNGDVHMKEGTKNDEESVALFPYSAVADYLSKYLADALTGPRDKVWLPAESTNEAVASVVPKKSRLSKSSPVCLMKAIKNQTELDGMRNAHLKDAVAHCEFLLWLENEMKHPSAELTERSVADHFEKLRAEQADFVSLSFETISAVGAHAASPHYSLTDQSNCPLAKDQVYLVDSGGQYRDGTTDVTRTVCFDEPTPYQKKCFTLVLKGHIQLAKQKFPERTNGMRLDTLSRMGLWDVGLDFRHGTGHGVGHYLNVHEGPAGIGYRSLSYATEGIVENMILTIEPGYYEDDAFGIRIENVYAIVPAETEYCFPGSRFLTFESLTFVPIQRKFLDPTLLSASELAWLNDYHDQCLDKVGALLKSQGKRDALKWLEEQCKPLG
uniref:Uncharacterized protein n=1 Tax=Plectus sambesii TaxID=2011161 RepID=A0A914VX85_9BILA